VRSTVSSPINHLALVNLTPGPRQDVRVRRVITTGHDDPQWVRPSRVEIRFEILIGMAMSSLERRRVERPISGTPERVLECLRDALSQGPARV
jgi:hypothetical protein